MRVMTFLSDFGVGDGYVAQMKGVVFRIADVCMVDISHEVAPHNVREGAFLLRSVVSYFPVGTVHVAVVDPGVGTGRRGLVVVTKRNVLVGPDNGLLIPAARFCGDFVVYEITNKKYCCVSVCDTFHGRDVFAPVAAHIVKGVLFDRFGPRITDYVDLDFREAKISEKGVDGCVLYSDRFGNLITNIDGLAWENVIAVGRKVQIRVKNRRFLVPFVRSYGFVKKGQLLVTVGGSGFVEIGVNQGSAAQILRLKEDDGVQVRF